MILCIIYYTWIYVYEYTYNFLYIYNFFPLNIGKFYVSGIWGFCSLCVIGQKCCRSAIAQNIQEKALWALVHAGQPEWLLALAILDGPAVSAKEGEIFFCSFKTPIFIFPASPHHPHQKSCHLTRGLPGSKVPAYTSLRNWKTSSFFPILGMPSSTQTCLLSLSPFCWYLAHALPWI